MEDVDKKVGTGARIFLALCAVLGNSACERAGIRDGDVGTIKNTTTCWQYPGGEGAGRLQAPLGQENNGTILDGAKVVVTGDEDRVFGRTTSGLWQWLRVEVQEGGMFNRPEKPQICWINTRDFIPQDPSNTLEPELNK